MLTTLAASLALALGQVQPTSSSAETLPATIRATLLTPSAEADSSPAATILPDSDDNNSKTSKDQEKLGFVRGVLKAFKDAFFPPPASEDEQPAKRRALPEPWSSPPFPGHEWQGYPLIGVPPEPISNPIMMGLYNTSWGDAIKASRIQLEGWVTSSYNYGNDHNSNSPASYWLYARKFEMDQAVLRLSRQLDSVQTDHIDWGFRSTWLYGIDYRYTTAGGWMSDQLLKNNRLYGLDPVEQYLDVYFPGIAKGLIVRVGRWIACPDIETQFAPDNYLASHSILFTFDTYTQTGVMLTWLLNEQWIFQLGIDCGDDMAPWYPGAEPCGFVGLRWTAKDNRDAIYTCLNQINAADFHHFEFDSQPAGHDNYNYIVSTWEHKFNDSGTFHTKTEAYFMWQRDAEPGGTPSIGPVQPFGGGGGDGTLLPGMSYAYGVLNYTMYAFTKKDYVTLRNEWWRDERGMRSGFPGTYTSHTIGWSHTFNSVLQFRPEIGYYRNWDNDAFDLGTKKGMWMAGFDFTVRF